MEFEAPFIVSWEIFRSCWRSYRLQSSPLSRYTLRQSKVYLDNEDFELYRSRQSLCATDDIKLGKCFLLKKTIKSCKNYSARDEFKYPISMDKSLATQLQALSTSVIKDLASLKPILILASTRRYFAIKTAPEVIIISFDTVCAYSMSRKFLKRFFVIELECNGVGALANHFEELSKLKDLLSSQATACLNKYSYVLETCFDLSTNYRDRTYE